MDASYERKIDRKLIMAILATGLMSFTGVVVETSMNVTFPTLMNQFAVGTSKVQWITTGYLLVLSLIIPLSSFLKKNYKTKTLFLVAITFFMVGIILDAIAPVFGVLLIGRLIQGVGTGIALPLMFNIVLEQVPFEKLGFMMGIASLITAIAPAIGPSFGGMIVNLYGWRMIFVSLFPLLIIAFILGLFSIRQVSAIEKVAFDWTVYGCLVIGFASLIFATSLSGVYGWFSMQVLLLAFIAFVAIVIFARHSMKSKKPIIHMNIFRNEPFVLSVLVVLLIQFICLGLGFLIPNYAQLVSGDNTFISGCLLLPGCIVGAMLIPFSGSILDRFGAKRPILAGNICILIATFLFCFFSQSMTRILFVVFYLLFAAGQGFSVGNTMTNGLKQLRPEQNKDGNAVFNTLQQLAGAIGTSVVTSIVSVSQDRMPDSIATATRIGSGNAFVVLSILSIAVIAGSGGAFYFIGAYQKACKRNGKELTQEV